MSKSVSSPLTFPFLIPAAPLDPAAVSARIVNLERRMFLSGRWALVLAWFFLLPAGALSGIIYSVYLAACLAYTLLLVFSGGPGRRVKAAGIMALLDYGLVSYLLAETGGISSPLQLLLPVLFFRNQLMFHGLSWAKLDAGMVLLAWLVPVKLNATWSELVWQPHGWAYLTVLGACAGLGTMLLSGVASPWSRSVQTSSRPAAAAGLPRPVAEPAQVRFLEEAPDWIFVLDGQGRFLYLNRRFETLFPGRSRDLCLGRPLPELAWPAEVSLLEELISACREQRKNQIGEVRFAAADAGLAQIRLHLKPWPLGRGQWGVLGVGHEVEFGPKAESDGRVKGEDRPALVPEEGRTEEAAGTLAAQLEETEAKLKLERFCTDQILAALEVGVAQMGPDFRLRDLRGPAREWFGPLERLRGMPCAGALWQNETGPCPDCPPAKAGENTGGWESCPAAGDKKFERRRLRLPGEYAGGGWLEVIRPVSEPPFSEQEVLAPPKPAAGGLVSRVAGGVAHEFNNIFSALSGFAILAEEDAGYVPELVQIVKEQGRRGEQLNTALLNLIRSKPGESAAFQLTPVLEETVWLAENLFRKQSLRLRFLPAHTPPVQADAGRLRHLLMHLLVRLSETLPKETELRLETRTNETAVEIIFSSDPPLASETLADLAAAAEIEPGREWSGEPELEAQTETGRILLRAPRARAGEI